VSNGVQEKKKPASQDEHERSISKLHHEQTIPFNKMGANETRPSPYPGGWQSAAQTKRLVLA
jgi:hypothetical protein